MKNHKVKLLDERGDNELTANHQPERAGLGKVAAFFGLGKFNQHYVLLGYSCYSRYFGGNVLSNFYGSYCRHSTGLPCLSDCAILYAAHPICWPHCSCLSAKCQRTHHACTRKTTLLETHWSRDDG